MIENKTNLTNECSDYGEHTEKMEPPFMINDSLKSNSNLDPEYQQDCSQTQVIESLLKFKNFYTKRNFDIVTLFANGQELAFKKRFSSNLHLRNQPQNISEIDD